MKRLINRLSAAIKHRAYECGKQDALEMFRAALDDAKAGRE